MPQADRCEVCGVKTERRKLVRTQVEYVGGNHAGNYLVHSDYNSDFWTCDATDRSTISYGSRCDDARTSVSMANPGVVSILNGTQTWGGDGTFRSHTTSVDVSGFTNMVISAIVGPYEQSTSPEMTVTIGSCASDGTSKLVLATFTVTGVFKVWATTTPAAITAGSLDPSASYWYVQADVSGTNYWWVEKLQLEKDVTTPGKYVATTGTAVAVAAPTQSMTVRKVCPDCFEPILSKSEKVGRLQESFVDDPVSVHIQEI